MNSVKDKNKEDLLNLLTKENKFKIIGVARNGHSYIFEYCTLAEECGFQNPDLEETAIQSFLPICEYSSDLTHRGIDKGNSEYDMMTLYWIHKDAALEVIFDRENPENVGKIISKHRNKTRQFKGKSPKSLLREERTIVMTGYGTLVYTWSRGEGETRKFDGYYGIYDVLKDYSDNLKHRYYSDYDVLKLYHIDDGGTLSLIWQQKQT